MTKAEEKSKEEILKSNWGALSIRLSGVYLTATLEAMDEYASQECEKIFEFSKWISHSDWTYLPSKNLWYNEEEEENITPKTTEQLYDLYLKSKT